MIYDFKNHVPKIASGCFVAPSAHIIGNTAISEGSSVWFGAVIRADLNAVKIGKNVSVQDNCVIHTDRNTPVEIADDVVIGHNAIVHSAKVGSNCIIGMGAILLSGSKIGSNCIIAAGAVVSEGSEIPDNSIAAGVPARVIKPVTQEHIKRIKNNVLEYAELNAAWFTGQGRQLQ